MNHREVRQRFLAVVDEEARRGGRGTIARAEATAELRRGWLYDMRRRDHIELAEALSFAEALGLDPGELLRRMLDGLAGPLAAFAQRSAALTAELPAVAEDVRKRIDDLAVASLSAEERARYRTEIEKLDQLRYEDAEEVVEKAEELAGQCLEMGEAELVARGLGVAASAHRLAGRVETAQLVLVVALEVVETYTLDAVRIELAQRVSYVVRDQGEYERAMELTDWAFLRYQEAGDVTGLGQTTVDKAINLLCQDRFQEAIQVFKTALELLPDNAGRHRFAALQGLGRANLQTGDLEAAERYTAMAERLAPQRSGHVWGHLSWLRAGIAARRRQIEEAEGLYRRTLETFEEIPEPFVVALVTVELVRWQLMNGRRRAAVDNALGMTALLSHLDRYRVVSAAIMDLVAAARLGSLSVELAEQVSETLDRGRSTVRSAHRLGR